MAFLATVYLYHDHLWLFQATVYLYHDHLWIFYLPGIFTMTIFGFLTFFNPPPRSEVRWGENHLTLPTVYLYHDHLWLFYLPCIFTVT